MRSFSSRIDFPTARRGTSLGKQRWYFPWTSTSADNWTVRVYSCAVHRAGFRIWFTCENHWLKQSLYNNFYVKFKINHPTNKKWKFLILLLSASFSLLLNRIYFAEFRLLAGKPSFIGRVHFHESVVPWIISEPIFLLHLVHDLPLEHLQIQRNPPNFFLLLNLDVRKRLEGKLVFLSFGLLQVFCFVSALTLNLSEFTIIRIFESFACLCRLE